MEGSKNEADIEFISCNLCGHNNSTPHLRATVLPHRRGQYARDEWEIVMCRHCGLIFLNPRPGPKSLASLYAFENPGDLAYVQDWFVENSEIQRFTWRRILRALTVYCPGGKLLDVGCGAGSFLENASEAGFEVVGQEVSPYFYRYGREEKGLNILLGELEDLNLPQGSFDCITAFDVIEHHPDPTRMLRSILHLLKPGGLLVIGTHDIGSWFARQYGSRWRYISPPGFDWFLAGKALEKAQ